MRHLIDIRDLTQEEIVSLLDLADDIMARREDYREVCRYKKLATLFFEPSTRTRLSFEAAMMELGGKVLGFSEAASSSASKGESVADTVRVVGCYADIIAMRHPKEGAPLAAALHSTVPIINAGDGGHNHPTQTLTDLLTIRREKGSLDNFTIGLCGDLKFGRTVHSLVKSLARYEGVRFIFISPPELRMPSYIIKETLLPRGIPLVLGARRGIGISGVGVVCVGRAASRIGCVGTCGGIGTLGTLRCCRLFLVESDDIDGRLAGLD